MWFHTSELTPEIKVLLPEHLLAPDERVLWVGPNGADFVAEDIRALTECMPEKIPIIWHVSPPRGISRALDSRFGSLRDWPSLARRTVVRSVTEREGSPLLYSDSARVEEDAYGDVAELLSTTVAGVASTLAFLPAVPRAVDDWSNVSQILITLYACRSWIATSPQPAVDADALVRSYVGAMREIGGACSLYFSSTCGGSAVLLAGDRAAMEVAAKRAAATLVERTASDFAHWVVGAHLRPSP